MAHRLRPLRVPTIGIPERSDRLVAATHRRWAAIEAAWRRDPVAFAWLALWMPFWIASDAPPPAMPRTARTRGATPPTAAGDVIAAKLDTVTRRFWVSWFAGSIFRGITLGLLVLAAWSLIAVFGPLSIPGWWTVSAVLAGGIVLGAVHGWFLRPDRLMVARMLDHTFGLDERIVTALDRESETSYVSRLQLADAANTLNEVLADVPRSTYVPVREAALCLVAIGALVTAMLANVPQKAIDPIGSSPVPGFVPASDRLAVQEQSLPQTSPPQQPQSEASLTQIQEDAQEAQSAREDLATLGEALQDNPLTQPAADSIATGSYSQAADQLREASSSVGTMPQAQRDSLADDLEAAADELEETNPELAQAARDAAGALREGGPEAEQALDSLADEIDQEAEQAGQQGGSSPNLDESSAGESEGDSEGQGQEAGQPGSGEGDQGEDPQQGSSEGTDPGQGSDAAPGVTDSSEQGEVSSAQGEGGGEGSAVEQGGDAPQEGDASSGGGSESESSSAGDSPGGEQGNQGSQSGAPDEETNSSQGSGAGTGQSGANDQNEGGQGPADPQDSEPDPDAEVPGAGEAGDPPSSRDDRGEADDGTGSAQNGGSSLTLEGTSDENVPAGNESGTSSLGSGGGSSTSSGSQGQGEVGVAGPDSNRVPENVRDVVQDFFNGQQP